MVPVRFVNKSGERIILYQEDGSVLKILENGRCWDRPPSEGTLRTSVISQHEAPPPPQPDPVWIDETEWKTEVFETSVYAPFKTITFLDGNEVRLKKRLFWKLPEMDWPVVQFIFRSTRMKLLKERLEGEIGGETSIFLNGIPVRKTVDVTSKYAEWKRWVISDDNEDKELRQSGESYRSSSELARITDFRLKEEERKKKEQLNY